MLTVRLEDPVIAGVAVKSEKWGFFQFPSFYRNPDDGTLVAKWNLSEDAVESYGKGENGSAISRDGGKTWTPNNGEHPLGEGLLLPNGDRIQIYTPLL